MESEAQTRRNRIDPKFTAHIWRIVDFDASKPLSARVEKTTQAVLAKAFRGELVPI